MWILDKLNKLETHIRKSFGKSVATPSDRFWAWVHFHVFDHAYLRIWWWNLHEIAPGVYRSNHPSPKRVAHYADLGIKAILNLRGEDEFAPFLLEREACDAHDILLYSSKLRARSAVSAEHILKVIEVMRRIERPFLFHCKSGADRAGLAAVIYVLVIEKRPVEEAVAQLSWKYLHLKSTATGIQDYIMEIFIARLTLGDIDFETWVAREYDNRQINKGFAQKRSAEEMAKALCKTM